MQPILRDIPEGFATERLAVSIFEIGDGEEYYRLLRDNAAHLDEEVSESHELGSVDDTEAYLRGKRIEWLSRERFVPKIVEKSSGRIIGQLWIEPRWEKGIFEIGYFLGESSMGRGYATEAVKGAMGLLFTDLGAGKLEILTKATNEPSIAVARRCGFLEEGRLRERSRTNTGEAVDLLVFGMLRTEYRPSAD
jgi:RimJ/RimL family protein N-acetyltransferase